MTLHHLFASLSSSFLFAQLQTQPNWPVGTALMLYSIKWRNKIPPDLLGDLSEETGSATAAFQLKSYIQVIPVDQKYYLFIKGTLGRNERQGTPSLPCLSTSHLEPHWHLCFDTFTMRVSNITLWFLFLFFFRA